MMRIAFSTISCPDYSALQAADACRRYGYDGVELYALAGRRLTPDLLRAELPAIRQAFVPADVPIVCLNSWAHLAVADPDERTAQARQIGAALQLANDLGCPLVKTFGGELPTGSPAAEIYDVMAASIERLCEQGAELGVRLVLETHDGFSRGAAVAELLRRVGHSAFAALWDVHHPYRMGETVAATAACIGRRVAHVHVKDALRDGTGWRFVLLGDGVLPVGEVIAYLASRAYDGYLSLDWEKMWHPELPGPEIALPHHAAALRRELARVEQQHQGPC